MSIQAGAAAILLSGGKIFNSRAGEAKAPRR